MEGKILLKVSEQQQQQQSMLIVHAMMLLGKGVMLFGKGVGCARQRVGGNEGATRDIWGDSFYVHI